MYWRDGSDCSSTSPEFNSQQPHGGSQPSVMESDALSWCVRRQLQCTHIYKINLLKKKKRTGEMAQRLNALTMLAEVLNSNPSNHMMAHNYL